MNMTNSIKSSTRKAAIYIRVSTDAQAEEGYSIEAQNVQRFKDL